MDPRQVKAEQIVAGNRITRGADGACWLVPSQSGGPRYRVVLDGLFPSCTCPDFELTGAACKHMYAVKLWTDRLKAQRAFGEKRGPEPKPVETPPTPKRKTYKQDWPNYNKAKTREKSHVIGLLDNLVDGLRPKEPVKRNRGRPAIPIADQVFGAVYKVYSGFSSRRFQCDLDTASEQGHLSRGMCYNSVTNALDNPALTPILKELIGQTALPLASVEKTFAPDSTGFCTNKFRRWFDHKWGGERSEHVWVKVHLVTGCLTNIVTAADILDMNAPDCPQMPGLIDKTAEGFEIERVCADMAYTAGYNFDAVAKHGASLYAPFKEGTTGSVGGLFKKAFHFFQLNRQEFLEKYHARSNVESTFSGIKRLMGDSVRSKTDTAMTNEVYCKLIAWNLTCLVHAIYEMGITPMFWQDGDGDEPRDILKFPTRA
jgi:hypothetical protein